MYAYAARINSVNRCAIQSEDPHFDLEAFAEWVEKHQVGYFLRDETSPYDCRYIPAAEFLTMYTFTGEDKEFVFRRVTKTDNPLIDI